MVMPVTLHPQTQRKQDYHMTWVIKLGKKSKEDWISPFEAGKIAPSISLYLSKAYVLHCWKTDWGFSLERLCLLLEIFLDKIKI